ncbi:hypothetical protein LTS08_004804 [Lithohypha guttulata]|uniref:NTF2-like domain-containing protein n=1 Tax=Lithohypha guttulata TaxID=1690604 RepID=A0AAN7T4H4_9EURO|nr:hypothetical protein LTR51_005934 [Lithohypha guttulata]KAK5088137.1 hypothetical protein LTR05_002354 [Lithohypha guttulata]KAK5101198.1 hypothetical protein LTS08_004804 [Lithohypha guttulata]
MKFSLAAVLAITGLAAAAPQWGSQVSRPATSSASSASQVSRPSATSSFTPPAPSCLTSSDATTLVNGFQSLISNYTLATAEKLLSNDFTDTSDSINILAGYPLGSTTFPSKAAFEAGQGSQPALPMTILSIDSVDCTKVGFRWTITIDPTKPVVKGINSIASSYNTTTRAWQIKTVYSEFNSCHWMNLIGGTCKGPGQ